MSRSARRPGLDTIRGVTLLSMMAYHACWDLVYLFHMDWAWYRSFGAYLWQQSICWTFILLSGYCFRLGRRHLRRGLLTLAGSVAVSIGAQIAGAPIYWGVLNLLGAAALLTIPLDKLFRRLPPRAGLAGAFGLFLLFRDVNEGFLGFEGAHLLALPASWYQNLFTALLGFPGPDFSSADYFSLLPWLFLFWTGYFLYGLQPEEPRRELELPLVTALGRHSLIAYLLHQPVIYAVLWLWFALIA